MTDIKIIEGLKLFEIKKRENVIKLTFVDNDLNKTILRFKGFMFETDSSPVGSVIGNVNIRETLGFKTICEFNYRYEDSFGYKQLLIEAVGSNEDLKRELICVFKKYKIKTIKHENNL